MAGTTGFGTSTEWSVVWYELFALFCVFAALKDICLYLWPVKVKPQEVAFELDYFSFWLALSFKS